jgi:hypothetical protein
MRQLYALKFFFYEVSRQSKYFTPQYQFSRAQGGGEDDGTAVASTGATPQVVRCFPWCFPGFYIVDLLSCLFFRQPLGFDCATFAAIIYVCSTAAILGAT